MTPHPEPSPQTLRPRVLVVDDEQAVRFTLVELLREVDVEVEEAVDGQAALERLAGWPADLVLTDLRMPRLDGLALLKATRGLPLPPRVVVITAHGSEKTAVEAMKAGAYDYFRKPFEIEEVLVVVGRALESVRLRQENERLTSVIGAAPSLLFASAAMGRLAETLRRVAGRDVTVLITGESGTGKERVAEALVRQSRRANGPFVRFNCASLTAELAEAELFGHARGAFTGAVRARTGLFREADGGTLLLDEVGELDLGLQARLLRVLQEGEVRPVGEDRPVKVDVRLLAATHRDLRRMVQEGRFREDLFWRLDVIELHVPPLRERPEDVPLLARHFAERFARRFGVGRVLLDDALLARLLACPWPGNVRELEHTLERMVALSDDGELDPALVPQGAADSVALDLRGRVEAYERGLIVEAIEAAGGNRSEAARRLGIGRMTLYEKMERYGLRGGL